MSAAKAISHNIDVILEVFKQVREKSGKRPERFRCWVDCKTGELSFAKEEKQGKNWKELDVTILYDPSTSRVSLQERGPSIVGFAPQALRVFQETLQAAKQLEERCYKVQFVDSLLINRVWYPVDRKQAEDLLLKQPIGTYLFRKDEFASLLEEKLKQDHKKQLSLWTISALTASRKCTDYTIVYQQGTWQFYNDDLSLQQPCFQTVADLIAHYKQFLRYPLYV